MLVSSSSQKASVSMAENMLKSVGASTQPDPVGDRESIREVSVVHHSSKHSIVELSHHTDKLVWAAKLSYDRSKALRD